jgi:hypothetical protein
VMTRLRTTSVDPHPKSCTFCAVHFTCESGQKRARLPYECSNSHSESEPPSSAIRRLTCKYSTLLLLLYPAS